MVCSCKDHPVSRPLRIQFSDAVCHFMNQGAERLATFAAGAFRGPDKFSRPEALPPAFGFLLDPFLSKPKSWGPDFYASTILGSLDMSWALRLIGCDCLPPEFSIFHCEREPAAEDF